jgi:MerR family mercuric resistance operon transcriptional regulator
VSKQTIAKAARAAGVHVETIRYYERVGLIERPRTVGTAYRVYPDETLRRIRFIKRAQTVGLSLREIRGLLALKDDEGSLCADVRGRIEAKVADIECRLRDLATMRATLMDLLDTCPGRGSSERCPIMRDLDGDAPGRPTNATAKRTGRKS